MEAESARKKIETLYSERMNEFPPGNAESPIVTTDYAEEQTRVYANLRKTHKHVGDMFLMGKPSGKMLLLLMKLYHENMLRNILLSEAPMSESAQIGDIIDYTGIKCMIGMLQDNEGTIYITTSEDPEETEQFNVKKSLVKMLLESANVSVENEDGITVTTYPMRTQGSLRDKLPILRKPEFREKQIDTDFMWMNEENSNYNDLIWETPLLVKWVDSVEYLTRRKQGEAFIPFRKYKEESRRGQKMFEIECNNGSTCTEAKLHAYIYFKNQERKKEDQLSVENFVAYWIGNYLPPYHHFTNFCYSPLEIAEGSPNRMQRIEDIRLKKLTMDCVKILKEDTATHSVFDELVHKYEDTFLHILKYVVQPFAIACPGCLANYQRYKDVNRFRRMFFPNPFERWDYSSCKTKRKRTIRSRFEGGKRRNKTRKN